MTLTVKAQDAPLVCDACKNPIDNGWADAKLPTYGGQWGNVCLTCARIHGVKYGIGLGQRYERHYPGKDFVLVEGA